jgi:hypothetical protein
MAVLATTNAVTAPIFNAASDLAQGAGRAVNYSDQYSHLCGRGTQAVVGVLTNSPSTPASDTFSTIAGNAWDSRTLYQQTGLYNQNVDYTPSQVTPQQFQNLPVGTVVCFNYPDPKTGQLVGHSMGYLGKDTDPNSSTYGQPMWSSDNVADNPAKFLGRSDLLGVSIVQPNAKGQAIIANNYGNLTSGENAITYTFPPTSSNGTGVAGNTTNLINGVNGADNSTTPQQEITLNSKFFNSLGPGATTPIVPLQTLQAKAQSPYSNKQFIAPVTISINVEGTQIETDLSLKRLKTNHYDPHKQNSVLSIKPIQAGRVIVNNTKSDRTARNLNFAAGQIATAGIAAASQLKQGAPAGVISGDNQIPKAFFDQHNLSQSIFSTGSLAITQNLAGRVPDVQGVLNGTANIMGLSNTIQALNPGNSTANTIIGTGASIISSPEFAPYAQAFKDNIQVKLPSVSLGSLNDIFKLASSIASSGPPTSITGVIALEQQIKAIICNFVLPIINLPPIDQLLKLDLAAIEKQIKQLILHEIQIITDPFLELYKQLREFFSINHLRKLLISLLPDPNALFQAIIKEFTTCNNGPGAKKNDLSGKGPSGAAPTASTADSTAPSTPVFPPDPGAQIVSNQTADYQGTGQATQVSTVNAYQSPTNSVTETLPSYSSSLGTPGAIQLPPGTNLATNLTIGAGAGAAVSNPNGVQITYTK